MEDSPSRIYPRPDIGYYTPTSAHISRFRTNKINRNGLQIAPIAYPVMKPRSASKNQVSSTKHHDDTRNKRDRQRSGDGLAGFSIWQDVGEDVENSPPPSPLRASFKNSRSRKKSLTDVYTGRSLPSPITYLPSPGSPLIADSFHGTRPLTPRTESNSYLSTYQPQSHKEVDLIVAIDTEVTETTITNDRVPARLLASPQPPATPTGGLRAKSKFMTRTSTMAKHMTTTANLGEIIKTNSFTKTAGTNGRTTSRSFAEINDQLDLAGDTDVDMLEDEATRQLGSRQSDTHDGIGACSQRLRDTASVSWVQLR